MLSTHSHLFEQRIVSPHLSGDSPNAFEEAYPAAYETLYQARPITCSVTGRTFDAVPAPSAVILDASMLVYMVDSDTNRTIVLLFPFDFSSLWDCLDCMQLEQLAVILCR